MTSDATEKPSNTQRLEAFSDNVFSIAITLLILEIKIPTADEIHGAGGLWPALGTRWPNYIGYLLTFLVVGVMWANHHATFEYLRRVNRKVVVANLFLLLGISFLPFPTAILADHLGDESTRNAATAFYGAALVYVSLTFNALWWVGRSEQRFVDASMPEHGRRTITLRYAVALICHVIATLLAFVNVWLSLAIHLLLTWWNAFSERKKKSEDGLLAEITGTSAAPKDS